MSILFTPFLLTACAGPYSILDPVSAAASDAARLWWGMIIFFTVVLAAIAGLVIHAVRHDPQKPEESKDLHETSPHNGGDRALHTRLIIGGGILLPLVSIAAILTFGIPAGHKMLPLPPETGEALRIDVTGQQWFWTAAYPGADIEMTNELYIPTATPVDIHLRSADVIHSFWVPRLGGKLDAIPGRVNILRLTADEPGTYKGQCAEFCGLRHAHMKFTVTATTPDEFERWLSEQQQNAGGGRTQ